MSENENREPKPDTKNAFDRYQRQGDLNPSVEDKREAKRTVQTSPPDIREADLANPDRFLRQARIHAADEFNRRAGEDCVTDRQFYVVWFSKTLQNWKALVSTDVVPGLYYEVTHNGTRHETYVDTYTKISNRAIPDKQ